MDPNPDSIRDLAQRWSLAGDDLLLLLLKKSHQKLISNCDNISKKFVELSSKLDDASINLQNVNNRFMALSNSQFIESRVYDDDTDVATDVQNNQVPPPRAEPNDLSSVQSSLSTLERRHEAAEIDDSESDSDAEISVVLRARDVYSQRPLPHVIGTTPWKNKWHAGLLIEDDSDSDSCLSKSKRGDSSEQYSDSPSDDEPAPEAAGASVRTISESSSLHSEAQKEFVSEKQASAHLAAEIARKLGRVDAVLPPPPPLEDTSQKPVKQVYRPPQPSVGSIFPAEPPPLTYDSDSSTEDDMFASLHKNRPYEQQHKVPNVADDLFGFKNDPYVEGNRAQNLDKDIFGTNVYRKDSVKENSALFEERQEAESVKEDNGNSTKKPVGGISLFGSSKESQSIGAAILNRNRRQSTDSDVTDDTTDNTDDIDNRVNNNDVFEQLFAKKDREEKIGSEKDRIVAAGKIDRQKDYKIDNRKNNQMAGQNIDRQNVDSKKLATKNELQDKNIFGTIFPKDKNQKLDTSGPKTLDSKPKTDEIHKVIQDKDVFDNLFSKDSSKKIAEKKEPNVPVKDLFSDNLFDDIDDIFTTNIKTNKQTVKQTSIFDDDDLFSDVAKPSLSKTTQNDKKLTKNDNDELFSGNDENKPENDRLKDDSLFGDENKPKMAKSKNDKAKRDTIFDSDEELFGEINTNKKDKLSVNQNIKQTESRIQKAEIPKLKEKSIFDSDSDSDIFSNFSKPKTIKTEASDKVKIDSKMLNSPSLFDDDSELFFEKPKKEKQIENFGAKNTTDNTNIFQNANDENKELKINETKSETAEPISTNFENISASTKIVTPTNVQGKTDLHDEDLSTKTPYQDADTSIIPDSQETIEYSSSISIADLLKSKSNLDNEKSTLKPEVESSIFNEQSNTSVVFKERSVLNTDMESSNSFDDDRASNISTSNKDISTNIFKPNDTLIPKEESSNSNTNKDDKIRVQNKTITKDLAEGNETLTTSIKDSHYNENYQQIFSNDKNDDLKDIGKDTLNTTVDDSKSFERNFQDGTNIFNEALKYSKSTGLFGENIITDSNKTNFENADPKTDSKDTKLMGSHLFANILSEPPEFEENVTEKRNKNINALFDDDSDDESMFLKKGVGVTDEKPNIFSSSANFGIFHDEPPDLDVDNSDVFQKADVFSESNVFGKDSNEKKDIFEKDSENKTDLLKKDIQNEHIQAKNETNIDKIESRTPILFTDDLDDLFASSRTQKHQTNIAVDKPSETKNTFEDKHHITIDKHKTNIAHKQPSADTTNKTKKDEIADVIKDTNTHTEKKIGKLNTANFNINVQALIPGSSPKRVKPSDVTDHSQPKNNESYFEKSNFENTAQTKPEKLKDGSNIEQEFKKPIDNRPIPSKQNTDFEKTAPTDAKTKDFESKASELEKSVSFDENLDSNVLDNNLSKQRARIQVKRRPSSRKARHEAAKKSVLDLDSDNSSSIDEPRPKAEAGSKTGNNISKIDNKKNETAKIEPKLESRPKNVDAGLSIDNNISKMDKNQSQEPAEKGIHNVFNDPKTIDLKDEVDSHQRKVDNVSIENENRSENTTDIGKDSEKSYQKESSEETNEQKTKIVYVLNDEDIFDTSKEKTIKKEDILENPTKSDDIFKKTSKLVKKSIFDDLSDDDSGLFGSNKKITQKVKNEEILPKLENLNKSASSSTKSDLFDKNTQKSDLFGKNDEKTTQESNLFGDIAEKTTKLPKKDDLFGKSDDRLPKPDEIFSKSDDLFSKSNDLSTKKDTKSKKLFDSDSDDELFGKETVFKKNKKISKGSLFGDDDQIFGDKTDATTAKQSTSKTQPSKLVTKDPLSLFSDSDD